MDDLREWCLEAFLQHSQNDWNNSFIRSAACNMKWARPLLLVAGSGVHITRYEFYQRNMGRGNAHKSLGSCGLWLLRARARVINSKMAKPSINTFSFTVCLCWRCMAWHGQTFQQQKKEKAKTLGKKAPIKAVGNSFSYNMCCVYWNIHICAHGILYGFCCWSRSVFSSICDSVCMCVIQMQLKATAVPRSRRP